MQIKGKNILVTGGANGLGFAYVTEFLRNGAAHVAILDLADSNGEKAVNKLNGEFGTGKAIFIICDVTKTQEFEAGFVNTLEEFGGLDIVVNNAGILDDSQWERTINVNFGGVVRGTLLALQYMGKHKGGNGGTIVNIASIAGLVPVSTLPVYAGTKHAIIGFTRSVADPLHYKNTDVRILTLCPGGTKTRMLSQSSLKQRLDVVTQEMMATFRKNFNVQSIEIVAEGMMHMIRVGGNGSVWLAKKEQPIYEIEFSDFSV